MTTWAEAWDRFTARLLTVRTPPEPQPTPEPVEADSTPQPTPPQTKQTKRRTPRP